MNVDAIILAGGFGTRLQHVVKDVPKPMAPVNGKPFLEYILNWLSKFSVSKFILSVGYKGESIKNYFENSLKKIPIAYATEIIPLGTGGGIVNGLKYAQSDSVLIVNGDTFFNVDLNNLFNFHQAKKSDLTICLRKLDDVSRFGTVEMDEQERIIDFKEKKGIAEPGLINGGIYLVRKNIFDSFNLPDKFSIEKDFFEKYIHQLSLFGFITTDYFIDIGIPEDYERAQREFKKFES